MTKAWGKVFIAGEYGVLLGKKALVSAIDRQASCAFLPNSPINHEKFFEAAFEVCTYEGFPPKKGAYKINTEDFYSGKDGHKLGLGSSAAAIAALCKLILQQNGVDDQLLWYKVSSLAHERFSSGLGSGADVAASVFGGSIIFQKGSLPKKVDLSKAWPKFIFIDTMRSQNTRNFVAQFMARKEEQAVVNFAMRSEKLVEDFLKDPSHEIFDELFILLRDLGSTCSMPIISPEHKTIKDVANALGGSAKPSGAGGGDLAIAMLPLEQHASFKKEMTLRGFDLLNLLEA